MFIHRCVTGTCVCRQSHVCTSTWRSEVDSGYLHQTLSTPCLKFYFMHMFVLFTCLFVHLVFAVPVEARRVWQIPWNWSCGELWVAMWGLGIEPESSGKVTSDLHSWAISQALPTPLPHTHLIFEARSLTEPRVHQFGQIGCQQAPGIFWSLPSQIWDSRIVLQSLGFYVGLNDGTLLLQQQALHLLSCLYRLQG